MKAEQAAAFAEQWAADWNRRDVEAVLKHFADNVVFISPKAGVIVGNPRVVGKPALRAYWQAAVAKIPELRFKTDYVTWDSNRRTLTIVYVANQTRAVEIARFDEHDRIVSGEAFYGAAAS